MWLTRTASEFWRPKPRSRCQQGRGSLWNLQGRFFPPLPASVVVSDPQCCWACGHIAWLLLYSHTCLSTFSSLSVSVLESVLLFSCRHQSCGTRPTLMPSSSLDYIFQARILEWVAISFCRRSSQPRDRTRVSHIASRHFTIWATRKALNINIVLSNF